MDITTLENWLWEAACSIRGPLDAPKYKDYILPLLFYKRLSDVYEDEVRRLREELGDEAMARQLARQDRVLTRFYIPNGYTWPEVRKSTVRLGERLTEAMREIAKENPKLAGVIDIVDFNAIAAGQRILDDDNLARLMEILNRQRLGLRDVEPDILGRAYEYLLRKFAEGSGQSAGEFYTPMEVATLMAFILDPEEGETIYDPACGSGGLLSGDFLSGPEFSQLTGVSKQPVQEGHAPRSQEEATYVNKDIYFRSQSYANADRSDRQKNKRQISAPDRRGCRHR